MAYVTTDQVFFRKLYPEQTADARFPYRGLGTIFAFCNRHGLFAPVRRPHANRPPATRQPSAQRPRTPLQPLIAYTGENGNDGERSTS